MAKNFTTWTVLPHGPLEKLSENLWRVDGVMPDGKTHRVMTIAKRGDGDLVIHNGIALEEPLMAEIEAFGKPNWLVVPNGYHRQDAAAWKGRYPSIKVLAPPRHHKRIAKVVPIDGDYSRYPADANIMVHDLDGCGEGAMTVRSQDGTSYVFNDLINNLPKLGGMMGFLLAPTGKPGIPRIARMLMIKDKRALRGHLERLATSADVKRLIVSHGTMIQERAGDTLREVAAQLG